MDRPLVYPGEIMQDYHILYGAKFPYIGIAKIAEAILGTGSLLSGFACTPTSPAGMTVNVAPGIIYSLQTTDTSTYGTIATDSNQIVKQGVIQSITNISCPAPVNPGESINYLIEIAFNETDNGSTVLPYYNASNILSPWSGPSNSGTAQNTVRQDTVTITLKPGVAATTGTQTTPNPDTGYVGAWVVTVAYGATTINSGNISYYNSANFILETLNTKISQATADLRYAQIIPTQNGAYQYAADTSVSANTITAALNPSLPSYTTGLAVKILVANTITGATTINLNGLGAKSLKKNFNVALAANDILANQIIDVIYDGTNFQLISASAALVRNIVYQRFTTHGSATYTPSPGLLYVDVEGVGGGGGGGGDGTHLGSGGGGGGYFKKRISAATIGGSQSLVIGQGGPPGFNGNSTTFGAICTAIGGNTGNTSNSVAIIGGAGGSSSGGDINMPGSYGGPASAASGNVFTGWGGNSLLGTTAPGTVLSGQAAVNGFGPGGGAGGSWNATAGTGSDGAIYITEYCMQ